MPYKFAFSNPKPLSKNSQVINVESCPNSFWSQKDAHRNKRKVEFQSSPIFRETNEAEQYGGIKMNHNNNISSKLPDYYSHLKVTSKNYDHSNSNLNSNQNIFPLGTQNNNSSSFYQNTDSMIPQYNGILSYSIPQGPMINSIFTNYQKNFPYQCSEENNNGKNMLNVSFPCYRIGNEYVNNEELINGNNGDTFPPFFNPRTASNMSHKEKVNNWIDNIPIFEIEENVWGNNCYVNEYSLNWEEIEFDKKFETSLKDNNNNMISMVTHDELLFLQSKKIDCLVRKMYNIEEEDEDDDDVDDILETTNREVIENDGNGKIIIKPKVIMKDSIIEYECSTDFI